MLNRREFTSLVGGTVLGWPIAARAQQPTTLVIGFLRRTNAASAERFVRAFQKGLTESGLSEGKNVAVEFRWGEGRTDRLPALVADLIQRKVAVILAAGSEPLAASKAATATIPIVFAMGDDPVKLGFVTSIQRPGGNITGIYFLNTDLAAKSLDLLREVTPRLSRIAQMVNPNSPGAAQQIQDMQIAARSFGREILVLKVSSERDFEPAFAAAVEQRVGALFIGGSALFTGNRAQIAALAARHAIPAVYDVGEFVSAGGLMSYGTSITDAYRQAGVYAARILKGENPAVVPVAISDKFELRINLKAARALGLTIPESILARADEVIE